MVRKKTIYTVGHSNRTTREFMKILKSFNIKTLVDIRHYPGSRHCPQFGKARLKKNLLYNNINYVHLEALGGRRRPNKDLEINAGWRSPQFRGYADYMQTKDFSKALIELILLAKSSRVAIMCSEAVPWRCHRSMVADALIVRGFDVLDLYTEKVCRLHKMTGFAQVEGKKISYPRNSDITIA
jgi:uncharacterized protein (DUF488 family)